MGRYGANNVSRHLSLEAINQSSDYYGGFL